jgi:hypothetical protein
MSTTDIQAQDIKPRAMRLRRIGLALLSVVTTLIVIEAVLAESGILTYLPRSDVKR